MVELSLEKTRSVVIVYTIFFQARCEYVNVCTHHFCSLENQLL